MVLPSGAAEFRRWAFRGFDGHIIRGKKVSPFWDRVRNFALNLAAGIVGTLLTVFLIDRVLRSKEELDEKEKKRKYQEIAFRHLTIPLINHLRMFTNIAAPQKSFESVRDLFDKNYFIQLELLDFSKDAPLLGYKWSDYLIRECSRFKEALMKTLDRYSPYLDAEVVDLMEQIVNSSFMDFVVAAPKTYELNLIFEFALLTGMRPEEYLSLQWSDVDFERGTVQVKRAIVWHKGGWIFQDTKTTKSRRTIHLPQSLVKRLAVHRREQGERRLKLGSDWEAHDLVFCGEVGNPLSIHIAKAYATDRTQGGRPREAIPTLRLQLQVVTRLEGTLPIFYHQFLRQMELLTRFWHTAGTQTR